MDFVIFIIDRVQSTMLLLHTLLQECLIQILQNYIQEISVVIDLFEVNLITLITVYRGRICFHERSLIKLFSYCSIIYDKIVNCNHNSCRKILYAGLPIASPVRIILPGDSWCNQMQRQRDVMQHYFPYHQKTIQICSFSEYHFVLPKLL